MERKHAVGIPLERLADWDPEIEGHLRCTENGAFKQALGEVVSALERAGLDYVLMGGIASMGLGRPRWTHDIDVFVRPSSADATLHALAQAGFDTERTDPAWLFKGFKHGVLVDVIFYSTGGFYLDEEMLARSVVREFMGHQVRLIGPEDLLVLKAAVHDERGPRHWHDALGVISVSELDWHYLLKRARRAPRRVLSLLVYAHSLDMAVPNQIVCELFREIYES